MAESYQRLLQVPHLPAALAADDVVLAEDDAVTFQFPPEVSPLSDNRHLGNG